MSLYKEKSVEMYISDTLFVRTCEKTNNVHNRQVEMRKTHLVKTGIGGWAHHYIPEQARRSDTRIPGVALLGCILPIQEVNMVTDPVYA
jgi:hypothetical protein